MHYRLQKIKTKLQQERKELATKSQAIEQHENSIEQLAYKIDYLRKTPRAQRGTMTNGNRTAVRLNSDTISPSSSFSSECYSSAPSEMCPNQFEPISDETTPTHYEINFPRAPPPPPHSRSHSVRVKALTERGPEQNKYADSACKINLNDINLSRVNEANGIPLGDLILSNPAGSVKRRYSESKLLKY